MNSNEITPEQMQNLERAKEQYLARRAEAKEAPLPAGLYDTLADVSAPFQRVQKRKCVDCGEEFEAIGLTAYCDPCGICADAQAALPPVKAMDSSWPRLHAEKLHELHGPAFDMAQKLAPRLFGNRLLVLAGDRGRGKTQIATFMAYHRLTRGHDSGIYSRAFDMVRLCSGYDSEARKALKAFQTVPFLCVDECHRVDPKQVHILEAVLDERYANKRPAMVIGNWMTEAGMLSGETVSGERLNGLGPTIMDRINEHTNNRTGGVVWCRWRSYRTPSSGTDAGEKQL